MISKGALNFIFIVFLAKFAFAQSANTLILNVVDADNAAITNFVARIKKGEKLLAETTGDRKPSAVFRDLETGEYEILIEAPGFEPKTERIRITKGQNELTLTLDVKQVEVDVSVEESAQEKALSTAFGGFLTKAQIDNLPDDPAEMAKILRQIAGDPNAVIRVDGFSSTALPPKSQISSIRISRSSFDAENHELGRTYIDISTKVTNPRFSGSVSFSFNDESLNARNAFAPNRASEQSKNTLLYLSGPIKKDVAAFSFVLLDFRNRETGVINAVLPDGPFSDTPSVLRTSTLISPTISFNLPKQHTARFDYQYSNSASDNLGIGRFNLKSRGFDSDQSKNQIRFSESGYIGNRFLNELRTQITFEKSRIIPQSDEAAILVLDAFNTGGSGNQKSKTSRKLSISDNLLFGIGKHAVKVGLLFETEKVTEISEINTNGTFTFSSLDEFAAGRPSLFTQRDQPRRTSPSQEKIGAFIQDDFQIHKSFAVSAGIRYEWQSLLNDANNIAPRLGFTWSPLKSGKTTFRGGFGIFYRWLETDDFSIILGNDASKPSETIIRNPGFPSPFGTGSPQILPQSFWQLDSGLDSPVVYHSSFASETRLRKDFSLRTTYIYEKGINQFRSRDINAPLLETRPVPSLGRILLIESSGFFVRNSFSVGLNASPARNISLFVDYAVSKITGDNEGIFSVPSNNFDIRLDRGPANNDQRHRLSTSVSWDLRPRLRLSAFYFLTSPLPFTITTGRDDNKDTNFNDRPVGVRRNSERGTWKNQLDLNLSWAFSFAKRSQDSKGRSFGFVTSSTEGGIDMPDPEKLFSLRFFVNAENVLNSTNFSNFVGVLSSPLFGQPISSDKPRRITAGIRFSF